MDPCKCTGCVCRRARDRQLRSVDLVSAFEIAYYNLARWVALRNQRYQTGPRFGQETADRRAARSRTP